MAHDSELYLGDWLRAVATLGLVGEERLVAAELCGLRPPRERGPEPATAAPVARRETDGPRAPGAPGAPAPTLAPLPRFDADATPSESDAESTAPAALLPTAAWESPRPPAEASAPAWLAGLPPLDPGTESAAGLGEPPEPLLRSRWVRAIVAALLATLRPGSEPDVEALTRALSELRPLGAVPRRPVPTLARGAQVLVDHAEALAPFAADQAALVAAARRVVGDETTQVLRFAGLPRRGGRGQSVADEEGLRRRDAGPGARHTWGPYPLPPPGTPVLVLTDLGLGRGRTAERASEAEWLGFFRHLARAGRPAVALLPYGPARWPKRLARRVPLVAWNERTSAATVRRRVGRGHEVRG